MKKLYTILFTVLAIAVSNVNAEIAVKSGETIAFMGDSITQAGNKKGGYVSLVMSALKSQGLEVQHIPA
ncbi:MAG: hypothetical protein ACK5TA_09495, partial [bacterium]